MRLHLGVIASAAPACARTDIVTATVTANLRIFEPLLMSVPFAPSGPGLASLDGPTLRLATIAALKGRQRVGPDLSWTEDRVG